ncbi:UNVERIFIED_ORG: hypothetical protein QOE_4508 [Clostridioides difficile F501]
MPSFRSKRAARFLIGLAARRLGRASRASRLDQRLQPLAGKAPRLGVAQRLSPPQAERPLGSRRARRRLPERMRLLERPIGVERIPPPRASAAIGASQEHGSRPWHEERADQPARASGREDERDRGRHERPAALADAWFSDGASRAWVPRGTRRPPSPAPPASSLGWNRTTTPPSRPSASITGAYPGNSNRTVHPAPSRGGAFGSAGAALGRSVGQCPVPGDDGIVGIATFGRTGSSS